MRRRKFLQLTGLSAPATLIGTSASQANNSTSSPIVISTWEPNKKANAVAWNILKDKGSALDAVHQGVMVPESDPTDQSVGFGGLPDRDGRVTLDACIMDHQGNCGAVMALEHVTHAISVARLVMEKTPHVQIVGEGALKFALANGFKEENLLTPESEAAWKSWLKESKYDPMITIDNIKAHHDTIGMLALDNSGNIAGACTTSGLAYKMQGRVGDSPIIGAGLFVDNEVGAATSSGMGEEVVRIVGSHTVVEAMRHGMSPDDACKEAIRRLIRIKGEAVARNIQVAFIALHKSGTIGCFAMLPGFTMAVQNEKSVRVISSPAWFN